MFRPEEWSSEDRKSEDQTSEDWVSEEQCDPQEQSGTGARESGIAEGNNPAD